MEYSTDKISIIIPVYNVEPYIKRCLDSVINQAYKNLEILLINDGSTDNSGIICEEYAEKDNRIRVFHIINSGVSAARNLGLKQITGQYVGFVDADDWVEPDMYKHLIVASKEFNVPISVSSYFRNTESKSLPIVNKEKIPSCIISTEHLLFYSLKRDSYTGFCGYVWNKLFRTDLIKSKCVMFDESVSFGEDALFYTSLVIKNKCKGVFIDKPLYHYSILDTSVSNYDPLSNRNSVFNVYSKIIRLLVDNNYKNESIWAKRFFCYFAGMYAEIARENGNNEVFKEMQEKIRVYINEYRETNKEFPDRLEWINTLLNE